MSSIASARSSDSSSKTGHGNAEQAQPHPHVPLVLREQQRVGAGPARVALGSESLQVFGRHVLVVERDDGGSADGVPQIGQVRVVTHDVVTDDLRGRHIGRLGEQS